MFVWGNPDFMSIFMSEKARTVVFTLMNKYSYRTRLNYEKNFSQLGNFYFPVRWILFPSWKTDFLQLWNKYTV